MSPAAGPLMARWLPLKRVTTIPPSIAEVNPAMGGKPEAAATPNPRGNATKDTLIAAKKSCRQCEEIPFKPVRGILCKFMGGLF